MRIYLSFAIFLAALWWISRHRVEDIPPLPLADIDNDWLAEW